MINRIVVRVDSFNGPVLINIKLIKVRLLQVTKPFLSSCHFINLNVFSIHINNLPRVKRKLEFYNIMALYNIMNIHTFFY